MCATAQVIQWKISRKAGYVRVLKNTFFSTIEELQWREIARKSRRSYFVSETTSATSAVLESLTSQHLGLLRVLWLG